MKNELQNGGPLPTDQKYYDRDYFDTGSKRIKDRVTGKEKVWGYQGTDWNGNKFIVEGILKTFNGEIGSVLDVGCGQGSFTDYALKAGLRAKGYDFSQYAVDTAHHLAKGHIFQADVTVGLPEKDKSCDLIFCSDMVEHIEKSKIAAVIADFYRITRKWVFFQFPIVDTPEDIFDFEQEKHKPVAEVHRLWEHFMIAGHLNMELRKWWDAKFVAAGFKIRDDLVTTFRTNTPREVLANWYNIVILEK
jgi:SAM-dependent methyltransferase